MKPAAAASSFKKLGGKQPQHPSGAQLSVHNGQLLTSTGLQDFDDILGGGVAVGTVTMIEEDLNTKHSATCVQYFLAEGVACEHAIFLASTTAPSDALRTLPAIIDEEQHSANILSEKNAAPDAALKIAWRYQHSIIQKAKEAPAVAQRKGHAHSFDLSKPLRPEALDPKHLELLNVHTLHSASPDGSSSFVYRSVFEAISRAIVAHNCEIVLDDKPRNLLRIVLQSFCSPLWSTMSADDVLEQLRFLHALRGLLRTSFAVCFFTFPAHLYPSERVTKFRHLCDAVFRVQSFQDERDHPAVFDQYTGLFHVVKLPRLNTLVPHLADALVYGFSRKRKKLYIEQLHLPPADAEPHHEASAARLLCAPGPGKAALDF